MFAATRIARNGRRTVVLERSPGLDPVPRTLIVTHRLRDYVGTLADEVSVNQISRFELYADGKVADVNLGRPDLIIERSTLIKKLAERAADAGVSIEFRKRFEKLSTSDGHLEVRSSSGAGGTDVRSASAVIGADGAHSRVAKVGGWPVHPTVALLQALVELPPDMSPDTARVWFRPDDTPYFYWLIPDRDGRGALGVIGSDTTSIRGRLDAFLDEFSLKAEQYQAAVIPAYRRWVPAHRRLEGGDVFLVGDAAGQVKVSTVGGVVTGFRGAAAVTDLLLHGRRSSTAALRRELSVHLVLRRVLSAFTEDDYRYLIGGLGENSKRSLARTDRDDAFRAVARFVRTRPGIVLRALRVLLTR